MNNTWPFACKGGYNDDMLDFIRSVVQHWLKMYGTQLSGGGKHDTFESPLNFEEIRYHELNHNIIESNQKSQHRCIHC